jgi:hypothetical protein
MKELQDNGVECSKIDEKMFTLKSEVVGRSPVVSVELVQSVEFSCEFPQISRTPLYEIIAVRLGYHKFRARWVPKVLMTAHKTQRMASALTLFQRYHKDGDEFLSHIVRLTRNETWVSLVNIVTKEQPFTKWLAIKHCWSSSTGSYLTILQT